MAFIAGVSFPDISKVRDLQSLGMAISLLPDRLQSAVMTAADGYTESYTPYETYSDVLQTVTDNFYGPPIDKTQITYNGIRGMMGSLHDKYTRFMDPAAFKEMNETTSGNFVGIGAVLGTNRLEQVFVVRVLPGGPAQKARILSGDVIVDVDGHDTRHMADSDVVKLIRGEPNTTVVIKVSRKGSASPIVLHIPRAIVHNEVVEHQMIDPTNKIGYISLAEFNEESDSQLHEALADLRAKGVKGLILDLRDNPGGLLDSAQRIASRFIPHGPVVWTRDRTGPRETTDVIPGLYNSKDKLPLAVLVNGGSASAAEILSGSIKDTGAGTLVGEKTFGKGIVQEILRLPDGSAVAITIQHYYTTNYHDINHKGIEPDILVKFTDADQRKMFNYMRDHPDAIYDLPYDTQLQRALQVVKNKMVVASRNT